MTATVPVRAEASVVAALRPVRDPELDESIVDLGFVTEASLEGGRATVRLRLPTFFCAPNFAYLMVADAHDAVLGVPGVSSVEVLLEDHFASAEINAGVAGGAGFAGCFPGEADGELDELRLTFRRKAHLASMERAAAELLAAGWTLEQLDRATLGDLPVGNCRDSLLRRRADLALPTDPASPVLVGDDGTPVPAGQIPLRLRMARTVGVSLAGNGHICRGLLDARYPASGSTDTTRTEASG